MPTTALPAAASVSTSGSGRPSRHTNRFLQEKAHLSAERTRAASASPLKPPGASHPPLEHLIFSAMRHLPVPILVLNNFKTVVYANEAIGALLGIPRHSRDDNFEDFSDVQMRLRGQTLCQVGVDMLQDGRLMWISWDSFFDSIAKELRVNSGRKPRVHRAAQAPAPSTLSSGDTSDVRGGDAPTMAPSPAQDIAVDVVICGSGPGRIPEDLTEVVGASERQVHATMIVTAWEFTDAQTYFTLTFTRSEPAPASLGAVGCETRSDPARSLSRSYSQDSLELSNNVALPSAQFPPAGPPSKTKAPLSHLQKLTKMKDVLLNSTEVPILAMWKDGSVIFPNKASRNLCRADSNFEDTLRGKRNLHNWDAYTEDFSRALSTEEYPISVLLRTEQPFKHMRLGIVDKLGRRLIYEARGELIRDNMTGEVIAGLIWLTDVTKFAEEISEIKEHGEERFKQICNAMPQLVWTTTGDEQFAFFNTRWYEYTGLTFEESIGDRWTGVIHPDDRAAVCDKWERCLRTGEAYAADYRVRHKSGRYRWFLGRANPLRDRETGKILKWFGTSTDVHETMEASFAAKRMRQQLSTMITHCRVTLFTVDTKRRISMLEGALLSDVNSEGGPDPESQGQSDWHIGKNVYDVFSRLSGGKLNFLETIDDVFAGKSVQGSQEYMLHDRSYRFEFIPLWGKTSLERSKSYIEGVIGIARDVTGQRKQEAALEEESKEKRQAIANEAAAKEANRLKSQFLANMSHEIRTPITGVLGMAEVLAASIVDKEQREYLGNIQRSASALLTVVNDILDLSKVESGRLDIEHVEFSLSTLVSGVRSMLGFIASKKHLEFQCDVPQDVQDSNYIVIGDPGRVRQVVMNLLTNSIKFTDRGYVKFTVKLESEVDDKVTARFAVEDSGIGMTDEVKSRLFQPFSQGDPSTARKFGGTGLGLTISKNLVELMGGRIVLDSSPGKGTKVNVWVPFRKPSPDGPDSSVSIGTLSDRLQWEMSLMCNEYKAMFGGLPSPAKKDGGMLAPSAETTPATSPAEEKPNVIMPSVNETELPRSARKKVHVLVVEDNAINQRIATKFVTMLGFQVAAVWNGKEALDYLRGSQASKNPKPGIILMDCQMPVVDGYKCTHALRHHSPFKTYAKDIPIIAMTASAIQGDREQCTRAGMDDYLSKPVRSKTLERMLIKWSRTQRPPSRSTSACSEFSAPDCLEKLDHARSSEAVEPGLGDLEESLSSPASETFSGPVTPMGSGSFRDAEGLWLKRRPSEDVECPWSQVGVNEGAFVERAAGEKWAR